MPESGKPSDKLRRLVAARAKYRCEYCKILRTYSPGPFETEHIIPMAEGGTTVFENLAYSCDGCNGYKNRHTAAKDLVTGTVVPLFNPRKDHWETHFTWDHESLRIEGLTPTGRATVRLLRLNRNELVNLRALLKIVGLHPPI